MGFKLFCEVLCGFILNNQSAESDIAKWTVLIILLLQAVLKAFHNNVFLLIYCCLLVYFQLQSRENIPIRIKVSKKTAVIFDQQSWYFAG